MVRTKYFLLILLLACSALAAAEDYNERESLVVETLIRIPVTFETTSSSPSLSILKINYSWMPREDYRQEILSLKTNPYASLGETAALFEVHEIQDFEASINFKTVTTSDRVKVTKKIPFPIKNLDQSLLDYTHASPLIDITPEISSLAASLAKGEDDLYIVAFKLADWVNSNIEYNLSTKTAEANLKSSWVLKERQGVCDEISNLYISMLRSLGIPARFVTGISYTESGLFTQNWGGHGWTEVYFPGHGWIPFDPTYDQLGFVDATHIKMDEGVQGNKYNTEYEWKGRGIDVKAETIDVNSFVVEKGDMRSDNVNIEIEFMRNAVTFGSYNVIVTKIRNNNNHYVAIPLSLSETKSMEIQSDKTVDVLLKPYEMKKAYWLIKISSSLREGFIYTFPASIYTQLDEEHIAEFRVERNEEMVTREMAEAFIGKSEESISGITVACTPIEQTIYITDNTSIECTIDNKESIRTATICWTDLACDKLDLSGSKTTITKTLSFNDTGFKTIIASFRTIKGSESAFIRINVIDSPIIEFSELNYPESMKYDEPAKVSFKLKRMSESLPKNITVTLTHDVFMREWTLAFLPSEQPMEADIDAKYFKAEGNDLKLEAVYYDDLGKRYTTNQTLSISLTDLTLWQRISLWFNSANVWLIKIFGG